MARPKKNRIVAFGPEVVYFKPKGILQADVEEICLAVDEREAVRLADLLGLSYEEAGQKMGISRATFGRIVQRGRKMIADALINGKAIRIEGGNYTVHTEKPTFICDKCRHQWEEVIGKAGYDRCPECRHDYFHRVS